MLDFMLVTCFSCQQWSFILQPFGLNDIISASLDVEDIDTFEDAVKLPAVKIRNKHAICA